MTTLLAHLIDELLVSAPFTRSADGHVFLLHAHPSYSSADHLVALTTMASEGFIAGFRYIDANPTPSVIAIRR